MKKILVIDDEKPTLSMFRFFLEAYGYQVFLAENGAAGLEAFNREKPAIVLTDIKMPGIDGLAILERIMETAPQTAVIVITGHGDDDLAGQAMALDAVDFINKPIKREALEAALEKALARLDAAEAKKDI